MYYVTVYFPLTEGVDIISTFTFLHNFPNCFVPVFRKGSAIMILMIVVLVMVLTTHMHTHTVLGHFPGNLDDDNDDDDHDQQ